jgi:hypothetical protein
MTWIMSNDSELVNRPRRGDLKQAHYPDDDLEDFTLLSPARPSKRDVSKSECSSNEPVNQGMTLNPRDMPIHRF